MKHPHDSIASISAIIMVVIMGICMLLIVKECEAWTNNEFQARLSGGDDWKITSLPESIDRSEEYDMAGKLGYLSYVYAVRENGEWDSEIMYMGPIAIDKVGRDRARVRLGAMVKAIDTVLPNERVVVISFVVDYTEMSIFLGPERWKDERFHIELAEKLNMERKKWKKLVIGA